MSTSAKSVYVLYTGGTIGCEGTPLAPMSGTQFAALVNQQAGLANNQVSGYTNPTISFTIQEFQVGGVTQTLDSSNMNPADWVNIASQLAANYDAYDGFVVLHGTDTMAFTASALSFLLPGLSKPVILTGSQLPLSFTLNDALPNLVGAIVLAATQEIPEVCLYFDSLLLRGNRSVKVNANQFAAFESPNFPPLATVGTVLTVNDDLLLPMPGPDTSLSVAANLAVLQGQLAVLATSVTTFSVVAQILYPGIQSTTVQAVLQNTVPPVKGMVILAFGEGNGPSGNQDFMNVLEAANAAGVVLMDNTQVLSGSVESEAYATGLGAAGAISAGDMTPEASLAKLVYLFGVGNGSAEVKTLMQEDLAGEITLSSETGTTTMAVR